MDRDELTKDVYAHFGLALYLAQCLEHGLANAMVFASRAAGRLPTLAAFDALLERQFERTLGSLINELRKHVQVDSALEDLLASALKTRNWLAHDYFRERAEVFITDVGCTAMVAELQSAQALFSQADSALEVVVTPLAAASGSPAELVDAYVAELLRQASAR